MSSETSSVSMQKPEISDFHAEQFRSPESSSDHNLRATVVFTNREGTQAALRVAGKLAKDLGARITLLAVHEVPFYFPLEKPPVSLDFLERNQIGLVSESGVRAEEVRVEMFLCRNRQECLRQVLRPRSLVIVGGKRCRWLNAERKLEGWLGRLGHHAVYVEVKRRNRTGFSLYFRALVRWMRAWSNRVERRPMVIGENPTIRSIS